MMEGILEDALADILCRISVKELSRLKCVCKLWNRLIDQVCIPSIYTPSTPIGLHIPVLPANPTDIQRLHLSERKYKYTSLSSSIEDAHADDKMRSGCYRLLDCCNGLLLFVDSSICHYYVFNSTFQQWFDIPTKGQPSHVFVNAAAALAFDPSKSLHYQIVRFTGLRSHPFTLDIYSSHTQQWIRKLLHVDHPERATSSTNWFRTSVYLNGVIYKLSTDRFLLRIDLSLLKGSIISVPSEKRSGARAGCIGLFMGRLSYAQSVFCKLVIWSLEDDDGTANANWVLNYSKVHLCELSERIEHMRPPRGYPHWIEPYAFGPNSDVLFFGTPYMILSYHLKTDKLEEAFRTRDESTCHPPVLVVTRSLVSLNNYKYRKSSFAEKSNPDSLIKVSSNDDKRGVHEFILDALASTVRYCILLHLLEHASYLVLRNTN